MMRRPQVGPFSEHDPAPSDFVAPSGDRQAEQAFDDLMELLPLDVVMKLVDRYYDRHWESIRAAATGDILVQIAQELDGSEKEKLEALIRELPASRPTIDAKVEAVTARRAFVAYWLNTADDAMRMLGTQGRVTLSRALLPPRPAPGSPQEATWDNWEDRRARSEESVLANAALDPQDLEQLKLMFAQSMERQIRVRGEVIIPPGDVIVSSGDGFELRPAHQASIRARVAPPSGRSRRSDETDH